MRRILIGAVAAVAACGGRAHPGALPNGTNAGIARPLEVYQQLGMLAGPFDFPAVAHFNTLAGPADSTYALLSMSMPNSAVRFQRGDAGFAAEYRVQWTVLRDTQVVRQIERRETVRVGGFAETTRTEESIIFQDAIALLPGRYTMRLQVSDLNSSRGFRASDTVDVPAYPAQYRVSTPMLLHVPHGRTAVSERPEFVVNARNTIPYGAENPRLYFEVYDAPETMSLPLRIVDDGGAVLWTARANLGSGSQQLRRVTVDVPAATLPLGRLWFEIAEEGQKPQRTPLLISISDQWMVASFNDILRILDYISDPAEIDQLRRANGTQQRALWDRFWTRRDPLPATPNNEFRDQFFERVKTATEQFVETGRPGWETDRGKVYIVFGPPDNALDRSVGRDAGAQPNLVEWLYESLPGGRLVLQFVDRSGFGHYELTPSSEAEFRTVAARMRPRN